MVFAAGVDQDVPDPYYGHIEDFLHARDMVADGVTKLFAKLNNI
jgi:protein-tyrosine-phosphatase